MENLGKYMCKSVQIGALLATSATENVRLFDFDFG